MWRFYSPPPHLLVLFVLYGHESVKLDQLTVMFRKMALTSLRSAATPKNLFGIENGCKGNCQIWSLNPVQQPGDIGTGSWRCYLWESRSYSGERL